MQIAECLEERLIDGGSELAAWDVTPATETRWYAVQVRSRQEAYVAQQVEGKGYEYFLPASKRRRVWSDRIRETEEPIFPGYLFCRFDPLNRLGILTTPNVIQIVGNSRKPIPVDESEITALQVLVASGLANQTCNYLEVGDRVRIESGPLRGLAGIMVDMRNSYRLVISVSLLQRSIAVEIDSAVVKRLQ
jgi:transcriptional antiterminator NusG